MRFLGIIPARFASTRLDGKPLVDICGKSMIQHVYERAVDALDDLYVATDDQRISSAVENFRGKAVMTSIQHENGTSRCLEAYEIITRDKEKHFDVIINIQGDEPLLDPRQIEALKDCFTDEYIMMATLVTPVKDPGDFENESEVFVTFDKNKNALYFSRSVIPYLKGVPRKNWTGNHTFYKHVGMYAYRPEALEIFTSMDPSSLELAEGLEQNRWLENGHAIKIGLTDRTSMCVDTPDDLERVREYFKKMKN